MAGTPRTVYIAGAGIAGMTLALALAKFGAPVVVLERSRAIQEFGAGVQISPSARKVLDRLGLDKAIANSSFAPEAIDIYPHGAVRPLVSLTLGERIQQEFGAPYAVMHRADLAAALYQACKRFANIDMLFDVRGHEVVRQGRGATVTVDEADGKSRNARAFAFVGADGVNSQTRTDVLSGPPARYSGFVAWRTTMPINALNGIISTQRTSVLFGPGYHAVCYPLPQRQQMNVVLIAAANAGEAFAQTPPSAPHLSRSMRKSSQFQAIVAAGGADWRFWPLSAVETATWHQGGVGLIGDAAHAMLPFQAQGAAMAIEDAAILAPLLMTEIDGETAFARYAALRRPRVERVRAVSASNGAAFHMSWPLSLGRDAVLSLGGPLGHLKRLSWLYGYDAAPELELSPPRQRNRQHS